MWTLGLDTSTMRTALGLAKGGERQGQLDLDEPEHSQAVLPGIASLLAQADLTPGQLGRIAVGAGPGSFTGVRIGLATAKGLAYALGIPMVPVSSLAAVAHEAAPTSGRCAVLMDARRGELFVGCYHVGAGAVLEGTEQVLAPAAALAWAEALGAEVAFAGNGLARFPALASLAARWSPVTQPSGTAIAVLGAGLEPTADAITRAAPVYLRLAEAEIMYPDGVPKAMARKLTPP